MTARQQVHYATVEFRPNPARPADGRVFLGIVFAFQHEDDAEVGWRWRFDEPDSEMLASVDTLSRAVLDQRKPTLRSELLGAMKDAGEPGEILACLSARNIWSFHVAKPNLVKVKPFDASSMTTEEWVDEWSTQIFQEEGVSWLERPHFIKSVKHATREPQPAY